MPQHSLFPSDPRDYGLRITVVDHYPELEDSVSIAVEVRPLDGDWTTLIRIMLAGRGRDFLASTVEDLAHAFQYEDRRAIVREGQRDERLARKHDRHHSRVGD